MMSKALKGFSLGIAVASTFYVAASLAGQAAEAPQPLLQKGAAVDWWFAFKFNASTFPGCSAGAKQECIFDEDGEAQSDKTFGQQFVFASKGAELQQGDGCLGDATTDPLGATFAQTYDGSYFYVVWNDQFYNDPKTPMCASCGNGTGHSKGMLAWNEDGNGFVLQVSTPSWPGAGNKRAPRKDEGNTLGCIAKPNNILVSQHFFALKLNKDDLIKVLKSLQTASVVTDPKDLQVVKNGGPKDVQRLVEGLGKKSDTLTYTKETLSNGVMLIAKPAGLNVPPWQLVSAALDGTPLRVASWWNANKIYTTTKNSKISCWDKSLPEPGPVEIALTGQWGKTTFELTGGGSPTRNHAKIGVSTSPDHAYTIFGDMNQEGALSTASGCDHAQNVRGGMFYVVDDEALHASVSNLIAGDTAAALGPQKRKKN